MEITVKSIQSKTGFRKDGQPWSSASITSEDGFLCSGFEDKLQGISDVKQGDVISVEYTQNGKYNNITSWNVVSKKETQKDTVVSEPPKNNKPVGAQVGMIVKEIGENLRTGKLSDIFGEDNAKILKSWYVLQTLMVTIE